MAGTYSLAGLGAKLASDVRSIVEGEVYNICEKALRDNINATVYAGSGGSGMYARTMDIMNAVDIIEKSSSATHVSFKVVINPVKIGIEMRPNALNAHAGVNGEDFREGIIDALDNGSSGSPIFNHPAHNFFDKTHAELDSALVVIIANALRGRGWDVTTP